MRLKRYDRIILIDKEDYNFFLTTNWRINRGGNGNEYITHNRIPITRTLLNAPIGLLVDHINGNSLDNRRSNLRLCTHAENMRNRKISKKNTSGFKGVYYRKNRHKWKARISFNGKRYYAPSRSTKEEAAKDYNDLALKFHGAFASLNKMKHDK